MELYAEDIKCSFTEIPFRSSLSFELLIAEISKLAGDDKSPLHESALAVMRKIETVPELKREISDFGTVRENRDLVNQMMSFVFNPLHSDIEIGSAMAPFVPRSFYSTRLFDRTLRNGKRRFEIAVDIKQDKVLLAVIYQAYMIILQKFYDFEFDIDLPFVYKLQDDETGTVRYLKVIVNPAYTEVKCKGGFRKLAQEEMRLLLEKTSDLDLWNEKIPLNKFDFTGFLVFSYVDITQEYVISQLKSDLLDKKSILSPEGFDRIREKVRALMNIPDLEFGLAGFSDFESTINQNVIWKSILPETEVSCNEYNGSFYEEAYRSGKFKLTEDLGHLHRDGIVSAFLGKGLRSHAVVPLTLDGDIVGMVEFASKKPGNISFVHIKRFSELFPVFAIALKRSKEELNDRIQAIIQEECTAIHPTVAWRFWKAATNMLDAEIHGESTRMEEIVFPDVIPLYGASDIRNSSLERNQAIQADLTEHLLLVRGILVKAMAIREMPLLDHLVYKIDEQLAIVGLGLKAGDEVSILELIRQEIEPVFHNLGERDIPLKEIVEDYFKKMDPELGVIYKKRKDFEDSLTWINDRIGQILDEEQQKVQHVFPHYFEKYRTDGIEYNIYMGQSLVKDLVFDEIYVKNIRLWQLMVKTRIACEIRNLIPVLKTPLDITQLILVQAKPLSIAFRQDEKKFDVAGAYNIRYEITKKRIDKAVIKGTGERITQVGKIAIIYSHADEVEDYRKFIAYMTERGYLKRAVEEFELEDMKGASGLKALRVEVDYSGPANLESIDLAEVREVMKSH